MNTVNLSDNKSNQKVLWDANLIHRKQPGEVWHLQKERGKGIDTNTIWWFERAQFVILCSNLWTLSPNKYSWQVERVVHSCPPTIGKSLVNLYVRNDSVRAHFKATTQWPCPPTVHTSVLPQAPSSIIPLSLYFPLTHFYFPSTCFTFSTIPPSLPPISRLSQPPSPFFTLPFPLCIKHTGADTVLGRLVGLCAKCKATELLKDNNASYIVLDLWNKSAKVKQLHFSICINVIIKEKHICLQEGIPGLLSIIRNCGSHRVLIYLLFDSDGLYVALDIGLHCRHKNQLD